MNNENYLITLLLCYPLFFGFFMAGFLILRERAKQLKEKSS